MPTTAALAPSLAAANPAAGIYYVPSDGSALAWDDLRMQLQYMSRPPSYPQAPLQHAQAHWPLYADDFRAVFEDFVSQPDDYADEQRTLHLYAGYLLALFRDADCFALAQTLLSRTEKQLTAALGEDYDDSVAPWLAGLCHHDPQRLQWLTDAASKPEPYSMLHRYIALQALSRCAVEGLAPRSQFIQATMAFCRTLIAQAQDGTLIDTGENGFGYDTYVSFAVADLLDVELPPKLLPELLDWFAQGHVDQMTLVADELQEAIEDADERAASVPAGTAWPSPNARRLINSIDQEFGLWRTLHGAYDATEYEDDSAYPPYQEPYVRTEAKVGRNDPCPCGSGKKYKKCCGA